MLHLWPEKDQKKKKKKKKKKLQEISLHTHYVGKIMLEYTSFTHYVTFIPIMLEMSHVARTWSNGAFTQLLGCKLKQPLWGAIWQC